MKNLFFLSKTPKNIAEPLSTPLIYTKIYNHASVILLISKVGRFPCKKKHFFA